MLSGCGGKNWLGNLTTKYPVAVQLKGIASTEHREIIGG